MSIINKILNILFVFIFCQTLPAQNEANKWYFGKFAGLDFSSNPPTPILTSTMWCSEGTASIADAAGNLLFYTDGDTIWNQQNQVMANGTGLFGDKSTTQSAVIVKKPASSSLYYVFTLPAGTIGTVTTGLCYSIVDMSLAAGMGSVTVKNNYLYKPSMEKMGATRHCNGTDTWIVTHEWNSSNFRAYLLSATGVNLVPVVSSAGPVFPNGTSVGGWAGYLKISPNGKKIGMANQLNTNYVELYDFDNSTGIISNQLVLSTSYLGTYGCEFSSDGTKFYAGRGNTNGFAQWDLCAGSNQAIIASAVTFTSTTINAALQLANNGKIYVGRQGNSLIGVINNPNLAGTACNFVDMGQSLGTQTCSLGLPNFVSSIFWQPLPATGPFTYTAGCGSAAFNLPAANPSASIYCAAAGYTALTTSWDFGDPLSGASNTSTAANPSHAYANPGTYTAQLFVYNNCRTDTLKQVINIAPAPSLSVSGNLNVCKNKTTTLTVTGGTTYTWSTASTNSFIVVTPSINTSYTVTTTNSLNCTASKVVTVSVSPCLGIHEINYLDQVAVYPNPNTGILNFETVKAAKLSVINQLGLTLSEHAYDAGKNVIDLAAFANGIYFIKVEMPSGSKTFKVIKTD